MRRVAQDAVIEIGHDPARSMKDATVDGGLMLSLLARILLVLLAVTVSSCAAIAGIFKAGVWTGIILAVIVVVIVAALVSRA